jgi:hypothetical protein
MSISIVDLDRVLNQFSMSLWGTFGELKRGDLPADLQRAIGGKDLNGRKAFPRSDPQNENII